MTKQEEIKRGLARELVRIRGVKWSYIVKEKLEPMWLEDAEAILHYLHSQGVVIKVVGTREIEHPGITLKTKVPIRATVPLIEVKP